MRSFAPNPPMRVFGERLSRLYGESVQEVRLAVLACRVQRVDPPARTAADGDDLQRRHVACDPVARLAQIVGKTKMLAAGLTRKR